MENNNNQRTTDCFLMRLKRRFFSKSESSSSRVDASNIIGLSTPPPSPIVQEKDEIEQRVEVADAGSFFTSEQSAKKKTFCFKVRKSRHAAGRRERVAVDSLQSRLLSQEMTIKDMEEVRKSTVILVDSLRTKIAAMERDEEMRMVQLLDMTRRLVEEETKIPALLEEEAKLYIANLKGQLRKEKEKWADERLQLIREKEEALSQKFLSAWNMENNTQRTTDCFLMRLKKRFFGKSKTSSDASNINRFSTPPPSPKVQEDDEIEQRVEDAALDAGSFFTSEQTAKKKTFCFKVRKSRHAAGRRHSVAIDNLLSRLISQEMTIKDMEEERWSTVVLVDSLRTKIAAMEKDKEMKRFQLLDVARLVEVERKMPALLQGEANLYIENLKEQLRKEKEKWAEQRLQLIREKEEALSQVSLC